MSRQDLSTSSFKEILILVIKCLVVLFCISAFILGMAPEFDKGYNASLIDKVERLNSIDGAKIVLIGDSNLAFGINSELIEQEMQMPVVNMGLHGGLGNIFHEEMAKLNVHEGDIYIMSFAGYYDDRTIPDTPLAWITLENHWELWKILRKEDIWPMFTALPTYIKKCISPWSEGSGNQENLESLYRRSAFNEYGDVMVERENEITFESVGLPDMPDECAEDINSLNAYLRERGAVLLITAAPVGECEVTPKREEFTRAWDECKKKLDAPVISDYNDYRFETKYFSNSTAHLTQEGAVLRTEQLIRDLKEYYQEKDR